MMKLSKAIPILGLSALCACTSMKVNKLSEVDIKASHINYERNSNEADVIAADLALKFDVPHDRTFTFGYDHWFVDGEINEKEVKGDRNRVSIGLEDKTTKISYIFLDDLDPIREFEKEKISSNSLSLDIEEKAGEQTYLLLNSKVSFLTDHHTDYCHAIGFIYYFDDAWLVSKYFRSKETIRDLEADTIMAYVGFMLDEDLSFKIGGYATREYFPGEDVKGYSFFTGLKYKNFEIFYENNNGEARQDEITISFSLDF